MIEPYLVVQELSNKSRGQLNFDWHNCHYIQNKEQFIEWKQRLGGNFAKRRGGRLGEKREVLDVFKSVQVRVTELHLDSVAGAARFFGSNSVMRVRSMLDGIRIRPL